MIDLMYRLIYWVYDIDLKILSINDSGGYYFNDKQLHFIVMGIVGMAMILIIYPIFKLLAKHNMTMVITFIYVFTMMIVLATVVSSIAGGWLLDASGAKALTFVAAVVTVAGAVVILLTVDRTGLK